MPSVCCNHPPPPYSTPFSSAALQLLFFSSILVYSLCSRPSWRGKTFPQLSKSTYPIASPISPFFFPVFYYHPLLYSSSHSYSSFTSFRVVSTTRPSFLFLTFLFLFLPPFRDSWHSLALHDPTKHTYTHTQTQSVGVLQCGLCLSLCAANLSTIHLMLSFVFMKLDIVKSSA